MRPAPIRPKRSLLFIGVFTTSGRSKCIQHMTLRDCAAQILRLNLRAWLEEVGGTRQRFFRQGHHWHCGGSQRAVLLGTMYIPYGKAYISGMNPISFVIVFTLGAPF